MDNNNIMNRIINFSYFCITAPLKLLCAGFIGSCVAGGGVGLILGLGGTFVCTKCKCANCGTPIMEIINDKIQCAKCETEISNEANGTSCKNQVKDTNDENNKKNE